MQSEMNSLKALHKWTTGRADLLYVAKRAGDELTHSNVLAWLLTPSERHGLGGALLVDLVRKTWGKDVRGVESAIVRREVQRRDELANRRADIVVDVADLRLVIENKVYAREDQLQCQHLYNLWTTAMARDEVMPADILFVLLSRPGPDRRALKRTRRLSWRGEVSAMDGSPRG